MNSQDIPKSNKELLQYLEAKEYFEIEYDETKKYIIPTFNMFNLQILNGKGIMTRFETDLKRKEIKIFWNLSFNIGESFGHFVLDMPLEHLNKFEKLYSAERKYKKEQKRLKIKILNIFNLYNKYVLNDKGIMDNYQMNVDSGEIIVDWHMNYHGGKSKGNLIFMAMYIYQTETYEALLKSQF